MFEKNLQDLVKGIRAAKGDPNIYISQCLQDIKTELKSTDSYTKAQAVRKLTYLHMNGYDMSWAAFPIVEVMSDDRFSHKRIGYLASCQSFTQSTDVVLLCTNLLKKELGSLCPYETGLAINCLANIVTLDLARDLLGDIVHLMSNDSRPYVRKKATLVLYKLYLRYPQGLRLTFDHLKTRMDENDTSVVSCAVNVICELANKKPQNYVALAPSFFRLLTTSSNNWMLIKVVKLMASLVPEEPRLARKLLEPLATIIQNTPAKSLLYECIQTVTTCLLYTQKTGGQQPKNVAAVVRLCNVHLRRYIEDPDQNLRYLGLVGLANLMLSHAFVVEEHQELILECLGGDDVTIRLRALDIVSRMITTENAVGVLSKLMDHVQVSDDDGLYRDKLIHTILEMGSRDKYHHVQDFEWYVGILVQLATVPTSDSKDKAGSTASKSKSKCTHKTLPQLPNHGCVISAQLIDIAMRVEMCRKTTVQQVLPLLTDQQQTLVCGQGAQTMAQVCYAAAWIVGEYPDWIEVEEDEEEEEENADEWTIVEVVDEMLQGRTTDLPAHVQAVYLSTFLKLLACAVSKYQDRQDVEEIAHLIIERLDRFKQSEYLEVQERACSLYELILALGLGLGALPEPLRTTKMFDFQQQDQGAKSSQAQLDILATYFEEKFAPVNPKAQSKVPLPKGLNLDEPMNRREWQALIKEQHKPSRTHHAHSNMLQPMRDLFYEIKRPTTFSSITSSTNTQSSAFSSSSSYQYQLQPETCADPNAALNGPAPPQSAHSRDSGDPFYLVKEIQDSHGRRQRKNEKGAKQAEAERVFGKTTKKAKKESKKGKKKLKTPVVMAQEMMPKGVHEDEEGSSQEDMVVREKTKTRRSKKKPQAYQEDGDDLSTIDITIPLRQDEKIPKDHLYHRTTVASGDSSNVELKKKSSKSKKKASKSKRQEKENTDGREKNTPPEKKKKSKKHSSKDKKKKKSHAEVDTSEPLLLL